LSNAKIGEHCPSACGNQDILGLDVQMHPPQAMDCVQRSSYGLKQFGRSQRPDPVLVFFRPPQDVLQRVLHVFQRHEKITIGGLPYFVHLADVRNPQLDQLRGQPCLGLELA
jgi:hypothetical protein